MAFYGKTWPIGLAPGMGINAFVAFGVVAGMGYTPQAALGAVLVAGILFLIISDINSLMFLRIFLVLSLIITFISCTKNEKPIYESFSSFQASQRDIAIVVSKEISSDELIQSIQSLKQNDLIDVNLFDVYEGEHIEQGSKSMALNLTYQSKEVTLTDEQLAKKVSKIVGHLETKFSAKLR